MSASGAVIETNRLSKLYKRGGGIRDLTMTVRSGEVFGFLGPNGAGKTTTIRTLMGLLIPTGGSAKILGLDCRSESVEIRRLIGNLPDDLAVDDRLTGRELISLLARIRKMDGLGRGEELSERLQADLETQMRHLSRGNRQKIGLIQAMFHSPELLILDEPTGGLDPLMQAEFMTLIEEHREGGGSAFISSHLLSEVERLCDRVGIVRDGALVAVETVDALIHRSIRRVTVTFDRPVSEKEFTDLDGVDGLNASGATLTFTVSENIDGVVRAAAKHKVIDLEVEHPTLEEVFLSYYGETTVG